MKLVDEDDSTAIGIKSTMIPVSPGNIYTASIYIKHTLNMPIKLYVKFYKKDNLSSPLLSTSVPTSTKSNKWESYFYYALAPEEAYYCQLFIVTNSGGSGEGYFDDICLIKGAIKPEQPEPSFIPPTQAAAQDAEIIKPVNNKLEYKTYNEYGDKLADFSYAGYYAGDYELPVTENLPVVAELSPSGGWDDHLEIQRAINAAERKDGGMNVIKLKAGRFYLGDTIKLKSGVLLSGEGQGPYGTVLYAYLPYQNTPVTISGSAPSETGKRAYITDEYVKAGTKTIHVSEENISNFQVGDLITINHSSTTEWSAAIGMLGVINVYDNDTSWTEGKITVYTERKITKIEGNEITLDFALFAPFATNLLPTYIAKLRDSGRVENVGIENLRLESYFNGDKKDESHATTAVTITNAKNIFLRDLTSKYFYMGIVKSGARAKQVTIRNCSCLDPVSTIAGSRRYSFLASAGAQQILTTGSYSFDARHDFATSREVTGPISYVDNVVDQSNTSNETHGTWSTGVLYDNIYEIGHATKGFIAMANRGIYGTVTSQGWTAASSVAWNCLSTTIIVHKPPLSYQNFMVGTWGLFSNEESMAQKFANIDSYKKIYRTGESTEHTEENFATDINTAFVGDAYKEAEYTPVNPRSLYKAQLSERYTGVITNAKPNAPIITYPNCDGILNSNIIRVTGVAQSGATQVNVYIDNKRIKANLNRTNNTFSAVSVVTDGNHKIYATQIIDGVEGNKTADRFVTVNESDGNHDYLQSIYPPEVTSMLVNDPRPTYDEYINSMKITDVDYEKTEAGYSVDVTIDKGNNTSGKVKIIAAIYGALGNFIKLATKDYDENEEISSIDIETEEEVKTIRVMLWEALESLNPLAELYKKIIE